MKIKAVIQDSYTGCIVDNIQLAVFPAAAPNMEREVEFSDCNKSTAILA
jgi:hypothetical protein